jgi:hypothetical protein
LLERVRMLSLWAGSEADAGGKMGHLAPQERVLDDDDAPNLALSKPV